MYLCTYPAYHRFWGKSFGAPWQKNLVHQNCFRETPSNIILRRDNNKKTKNQIKTMTTVLLQKVSPHDQVNNVWNEKLVYCKNYTIGEIVDDLVRFYELAPGISLSMFLVYYSIIPKTTFMRHYKASLLKEMKGRKESVERARVAGRVYLANLLKSKWNRTGKASWTNRYLTHDEEQVFVQIIRIIGNMGYGVTHQEALSMIDDHIHEKIDARDAVECSEKVLRAILSRNKEIKIGSAGSLDPQRAKKATKDTRDAVFTKLDTYIRNLNAMELVTWKSYSEVPTDSIYNMDEVGTDTIKHRSKIICDTNTTIRHYCQTNAGDGKLNMHITACLTTRADGKFRTPKGGLLSRLLSGLLSLVSDSFLGCQRKIP